MEIGKKSGTPDTKGRFAWMRDAMPGVARQVAEKRRKWGDEHVTRCILRSFGGEPGWFFAREGHIAVGTPWDEPELVNFAALTVTATQALVVMRSPDDGA